VEAVLLLLPALVALLYGENPFPFLITVAIVGAIGGACMLLKPESGRFYAREGFITVGLCWILLSAFGALPFVFSREIPSYIDALFETISGFTTTGSSILTNVEGLSNGMLFWRSFTHWVGGMGVLVFVMAVLPLADVRSVHLMRAEVPGPTKSKLVPKMRNSATILYAIYVVMTVIEVIFLCAGDMPLFDAILHSFGTAGTGGFGTKNISIAHYDSAYVDIVISVFMLLFGINFNLYYMLLLRDFKSVFKNEELRWYLGIVAACTVAIAVNLLSVYQSVGQSLRFAFFQVSSIITTTGYSTADFNLWPAFSQTILVILMLVGASAGSTGGGIKVARIMLAAKTARREIRRMRHPRTVSLIRMDGRTVDETTIHSTSVFLIVYFGLLVLSLLLVSLDGFDFTTNVTSVVACLGNIGPGLSVVGPMGSFASLSWFSKLVLSLDMLLGRLELFPILMLFAPASWWRKG